MPAIQREKFLGLSAYLLTHLGCQKLSFSLRACSVPRELRSGTVPARNVYNICIGQSSPGTVPGRNYRKRTSPGTELFLDDTRVYTFTSLMSCPSDTGDTWYARRPESILYMYAYTTTTTRDPWQDDKSVGDPESLTTPPIRKRR